MTTSPAVPSVTSAPAALSAPASQSAADTGPRINPAYLNIGESLVRELSRMMSVPGMISLAGGYPSPAQIEEGVARIGRAVAKLAGQARRAPSHH